ncbi:MAG: YncE family protein [Bacteroidia bacterium]|nr:YncE family protein [Bacteroidia bacterium]
MQKIMLTISFLFLLTLGGIGSLFAQNYYAYATAESEDEVALVKFDGEKAEAIQRIPVGYIPTEIEGPHGISVSPDKKHWYLSMAHGMPYGKVYKFTTGDNKLVGTTELGLFPATMQISPATGLMYVVNFNLHGKMVPSSVSVVDPETMTELKKITTGSMPHGSRISPDGMFHYSVAMMSGELFEIDAASLEVSRTLSLDEEEGGMDHSMQGMDHSKMDHSKMDHSKMDHSGMGGGMKMKHSKVKPTWVIPHPTNNKLYVAGNGVAEVLEVDRAEWKITRKFSTGKGPYNVEISPNGKLMVVTYKSDAQTGVWNLETGEELARIPNSRKVSHGIAITPDSKFAFVTAEGIGAEPGSVDVIDLTKLELVSTADIGKQAGGIYFWKMED